MTLIDAKNLLDAKVLTVECDDDLELKNAFASDMMSHVLAYASNKSVLITALNNPQSLRTADLMGIPCVIFIGRKDPDPSIVELADKLGIVLMHSPHSLYTTCGLLYSNGMKGSMREND